MLTRLFSRLQMSATRFGGHARQISPNLYEADDAEF